MKILVDMNLSPRWVPALQTVGFEARHWSGVGAPNAPDEEVLSWTSANGYILLTNDLDFGAILASSEANIPSVIQIRTADLRAEVLIDRIASILARHAQAMADGALVTIEPARERVRILPLRPERSV